MPAPPPFRGRVGDGLSAVGTVCEGGALPEMTDQYGADSDKFKETGLRPPPRTSRERQSAVHSAQEGAAPGGDTADGDAVCRACALGKQDGEWGQGGAEELTGAAVRSAAGKCKTCLEVNA